MNSPIPSRKKARFRLRLDHLEDRTAPALDPTFGVGGKQTIDFGDNSEVGRGVVLQGDGKIVVAGKPTKAKGLPWTSP